MLRKKLKLSGNELEKQDSESEDGADENSSKIEAGSSKNLKVELESEEFTVTFEMEFWEKIWKVEKALAAELEKLDYMKDKNIAAVYNPLDYAADIHENFMKKYLKRAPTVVFLGMNPGLLGMCQTSIPFGHVPLVKNWLKVEGQVNKPKIEIKAKPIEGLSCKKEEQSGKRFWGVLQELCGEPENFFRHCFVYNICPLAFLTSSGRNITPTEIKGEAKNKLNVICIDFLKQILDLLNPKVIISVGVYANNCVKDLKKRNLLSPEIDCKLIPHPSPRAINNNNWMEVAKKFYIDNDITKYFKQPDE